MPGSSRRRLTRRRRRDARKALLEIPDQILDGLDADREANRARADASGTQLLFAELAMRRAGRVNDQALRVADVREVRPQRHAADEVLPRRTPTAAIEREHRACALRQVLLDERAVLARLETRIRHVRDQVVR